MFKTTTPVSDRAGLKLECCNGTLIRPSLKRTFPWGRSTPDCRIEGSTALAIANGFTERYPYSVCLWGSHPDEQNDDCHTGESFATLAEAREAFAHWDNDQYFDMAYYRSSTTHVEIDGPDINEVKKVVSDAEIRRRARRERADDRDWQREIAMQAGMGIGIDAYNDEMGWG